MNRSQHQSKIGFPTRAQFVRAMGIVYDNFMAGLRRGEPEPETKPRVKYCLNSHLNRLLGRPPRAALEHAVVSDAGGEQVLWLFDRLVAEEKALACTGRGAFNLSLRRFSPRVSPSTNKGFSEYIGNQENDR